MNQLRLSPNNPVRRRLFDDLDAEEAALDNFANVLQEEALRVKNEKMRKWNFDFENEIPLDGAIEWIPSEHPIAYTGKVKNQHNDDDMDAEEQERENTEDECENANLLQKMQIQTFQKNNETTPDRKSKEDETPLMDERRRESTEVKTGNFFSTDKSVRRNIKFE